MERHSISAQYLTDWGRIARPDSVKSITLLLISALLQGFSLGLSSDRRGLNETAEG